jgi:hypothetical protein
VALNLKESAAHNLKQSDNLSVFRPKVDMYNVNRFGGAH